MSETDIAELLLSVWRRALVEKAPDVKIGSRSYRVTQIRGKRLRQVEFLFDGNTILGIEQNPNTKSRWATIARSGKPVMQFIQDGKYIAAVAQGKVTWYGKKT